ncbi:TPM domain-containing protein [Ralstonia solanacearum]|uniref:TPM domain-containing protein n=1 Tax=Ralstonia solanacearum TaxID=305 RepID=UPI0005ABE67D|nr:YgcG family protein [Ralstonia solanacearum]MDC6177077.1 YgcG family protein [Ralstonia solanacearum]MDC6238391.1 YgcG family protein [Ralstonia solanacearum]
MNLLTATRGLLVAVTALMALGVAAEVAIPPLTARVTDQTGTLTTDQQASLEASLQVFEAKKGSQVGVLIVPTTQPETIEQYSIRVVEQWKLGRKRVDDGALLIIAKDDRAVRIEVGYGLEGVLTDAASKRIISEVIVPQFRQGDFYGGVTAGVNSMLAVMAGEPLPPPTERTGYSPNSIRSYMPVILLVSLVVGGALRAVLGRFPGSVATGGAVGLVAWMLSGVMFVAVFAGAIALMFTLLGGGMGAHVGSRSIGGRQGGGGFGGGGGGFGGGGASGKW